MSVQLSPHAEEILSAYHEELPILQRLAQKTYDQLNEVLRAQGVEINSIERRVKTEKSLRGKLEIKGGKYNTINDVTDLVGIRVITYYTDDVDKVAAIVKNLFKVDWENSVDKRKLHKLDSFGYNSLHYICHLKAAAGVPPTVQPSGRNVGARRRRVQSSAYHNVRLPTHAPGTREVRTTRRGTAEQGVVPQLPGATTLHAS